MSDESKFSITKQFHTVRGDTLAEFQANVEALLGPGSFGSIVASYHTAFGTGVTEQQAVQNVQAIGATPVATPPSTVGQPLPAPAPAAPFTPDAPSVPATVPYPGDCPHGTRVYVDKPARGRPWRRWECAIPWSKETATSRCKPVNVEG